MVFVDREDELQWLKSKWESSRGELLVIYGRRRIGKTELAKKFIENRPILYFISEETSEHLVLEKLSYEMSRFFDDELLFLHPFNEWKQVFAYIAKQSVNRRVGLILDEFQYIARTSPNITSIIQVSWDQWLKNSRAFIVLMGSAVSFSEGLLSEKNPLYGRITGYLKLKPLSPLRLREFTPNWSPEDRIRLYTVFGGIPGYLVEVDSSKSIWDNIKELILSKRARFLDEAKILLKEELREVHRYFAILEAIANGATSYGEISSKSKVPVEALSKYLAVLEDMGYIIKEYPVIGGGRARYKIVDQFLRFWFKYIPVHRSAIELGFAEQVLQHIKQDLDSSLVPQAWEEVVAEIIVEKTKRKEIDIVPSKIGKWWYRGEEIDVVILDEVNNKILLCEVKWSTLTHRDVRRILDKLRSTASRIPWGGEQLYVVAAKEVIGTPRLLVDEIVITLKDYDELSV